MRVLEDVQTGDVNMWGKLSERKPSVGYQLSDKQTSSYL